jgi:hypothetical protein
MKTLHSTFTRIGCARIVLFVLALGCGEAPTSPSPAGRFVPRQAAFASQQNGSEITIWADDGTAYTLYVNSQRIVRGDGLVIELSAEQTITAANAFEAIVIGDTQATTAQNNVSPPDCPRDQYPCVIEPNAPVRQSDASESQILVRKVATDSDIHGGGRFRAHGKGPTNGVNRYFPMSPAASDPMSTSEADWPPSCLDIARAIYDAMPAYRAARSVITNTLAEITQHIFSWDEFGNPHSRLYELPELAMDFDQNAYAFENSWMSLTILGAMYSGYGCWSNDWPDAQRPSLGAGTNRVCNVERWEISTDGGASWHWFDVLTCEYVL